MEINSLLMPLLAPRDYPGVHGPRGKFWEAQRELSLGGDATRNRLRQAENGWF